MTDASKFCRSCGAALCVVEATATSVRDSDASTARTDIVPPNVVAQRKLFETAGVV